MTAVAGNINNLIVLGLLMQTVDVLQLDAIVDSVPDPTQEPLYYPDCRIRNMGGNFVSVLAGLLGRPFEFYPAVSGFGSNCSADTRITEYVVKQSPAMRQVGANGCYATLPEMHPENSRHFSESNFGFEAVLHD